MATIANPNPHAARPSSALRVVLLSTYELGRQPFGIASPAGWLRSRGFDVGVRDLAIESLDETQIRRADLVAFHVPMHTATRLAAALLPQIRELNPEAHVCFFGLYAPLNREYLADLGVDTIIGTDVERGLVELCERIEDAGSAARRAQDREGSTSNRTPDRRGLPGVERYARLRTPGAEDRIVGSTEATRGCKHTCRHCPIVPVYGGRFSAVPRAVVIDDVRRQVAAGAQHITFGDPDFLNGPAHSLRIVEQLHEEFPDLTYDVTIKVQHLADNLELLPTLQRTGCALVTSAIESFDDDILEIFDKRHTAQDLERVVEAFRAQGLALNPTFVAFTPWTSLDGYLAFLEAIRDLHLVDGVTPVQYIIRLLVTAGSRLLELPEVVDLVEEFDASALVHPWAHPDPLVDELHRSLTDVVTAFGDANGDRRGVFARVWDTARSFAVAAGERDLGDLVLADVPDAVTVPYLTEPWYC